jgi:hypothetical protein
MLVYGIRCSPIDLTGLPTNATADYYLDYSLLVFPAYTRKTCVNSHGNLSPYFWNQTKRVVQFPSSVSAMDLEQPWISDEEEDVLQTLRQAYPTIHSNWYYVPKIISSV